MKSTSEELQLYISALEDLSISGNVAFIESKFGFEGSTIQTSKERPLQGQSPYAVMFNWLTTT